MHTLAGSTPTQCHAHPAAAAAATAVADAPPDGVERCFSALYTPVLLRYTEPLAQS